MSQERLTELMFGLIWPPTSPAAIRQSVIDILAQLETLRGKDDGLTEDEYAGWRKDVLDGVASNRHHEPVYLTVCGFFSVLLAGLLTFALLSGRAQLAWAAGGTLVLLALMALRLARGWTAKKRLTVAERLELVAELARRGLVTPEEALELGNRIAKLAPGEPGASN